MQRHSILITGAAGFIGSHLFEALRVEHSRQKPVPRWSVAMADINYGMDWPCREGVRFKKPLLPAAYHCVDLRDFDAVQALFKAVKPDVIYHLAAYFGGMTILEAEEHRIVRDNSLINNNLAEATMRWASASGRTVRFFFSSSQCVYRDQSPGDRPLTESEAWDGPPPNLYGGEKRLAEQVFLAMPRHAPVEVVIARFGNCYGPGGQWDSPKAKAPAALCYKAVKAPNGGRLEIYGSGHAVRSYIYIEDLISGVLMMCPPEGPVYSGEVFNLSSEEYVTVRELAQTVVRCSGKRLDIVSVPGPIGNHARYVSCAKARDFLCVLPMRTLESGIRLLYEWVNSQVELRPGTAKPRRS